MLATKMLVLSAVIAAAAVAPSQAALMDLSNSWGLGFGDSPFGAEAQAQQLSEAFNSKPDSDGPPFDFSGGESQADAFGEFDAAFALADGAALEGLACLQGLSTTSCAKANTLSETFASSNDASSLAQSVAESDDRSIAEAEADSIALTGSAFSEADAFGSSSGNFAGSVTKADAAGGINAVAVANSVTEPYNTLVSGGAFSEADAVAYTGDSVAVADSLAVADQRAISEADAFSATDAGGSASALAESVSIANDAAEADAEVEAVSLGGGGADSSALAVASGSGVEELGMAPKLGGALLCKTAGRKLLGVC